MQRELQQPHIEKIKFEIFVFVLKIYFDSAKFVYKTQIAVGHFAIFTALLCHFPCHDRGMK